MDSFFDPTKLKPQTPGADTNPAPADVQAPAIPPANPLAFDGNVATPSVDGAPATPQFSVPEKQGFWDATIHGVDDTKTQGFGTRVSAALTDFARTGTQATYELLGGYDGIRKQIDDLRAKNPNDELANQLENTIGKKRSTGKLALQSFGAIVEGVLTVIPAGLAFNGLKAAVGVGRAAKALEVATDVGKVVNVADDTIKTAKASKVFLNHVATGFGYGAAFGGATSLRENGDFSEFAKDVLIGGGFGAGLTGFGEGFIRAAGMTGTSIKKAGQILADTPALKDALTSFYATPVGRFYSTAISSTASRMSRYYGEYGKQFVDLYNKAGDIARTDLGKLSMGMIENGLVEAPALAKRFFKNVQYVGNDRNLMTKYDQVLRGEGIYADPNVQRAMIESDARLAYLDYTRKWYGTQAQRSGVTDSLLDPEKYLPKYTPSITLSKGAAGRIESAATPEARIAIYESNDETVKEMVEHSVEVTKAFKNKEEAYKAYYDYQDIVNETGRIKDLANNSFLQRMVNNGEASSIMEAKGKVLQDLKQAKQSITANSASLDFKRKVNLPWYDPNPARVMPLYTADASLRLANAKMFGADDEVIKELQGKIASDASFANPARAAQEFEKLIRIITGQVDRSPGLERGSAIIRALQVPKLAFAAVLNVGQNLNYVLSTDFKSAFFGLTKAFTEDGARKAIESGSLLNSYLRDIYSYSGGGTKIADNFMKWTGFTTTEMFNRMVGSSVAEKYATGEFAVLAKKLGVEVATPEQRIATELMLADKAGLESEIGQSGLAVQKEYAAKWKKLYPDEPLQLSAGDIGAAKKKLDIMDKDYGEKIGVLQKTRKAMEGDLLATSEPLTKEGVADLQNVIKELRGQLNVYGGGTAKLADAPVEARVFTEGEKKTAVEAAIKLKRSKMEAVIERLESQVEEARATGIVDLPNAPAPKKPVLDAPDHVAAINAEIKDIDSEILRLTNEQSDKERLLQTMVDSYAIAENKLKVKYAGAGQYDSTIGEKAKTLSSTARPASPEEFRLKELGIDVDSALARGYLTKDDLLQGGAKLVERTQFMSRPLDLPGWASHPAGKVFAQFRTFAYQQAKFVKKTLMDDLATDKPRFFRDLLVLSTVYPMAGEVLGDVRSLITGERRPTAAFDRYLADLASAGSYGIVNDFLSSSKSGRILEFGAGPSVSDAANYIQNTYKAITGNPKQLLKQTVGQVGVFRPVVNYSDVFDSTAPGKSTVDSLIDWADDR